MNSSKIIMLCGYKRTGKDILFKKISLNKEKTKNLFSWKVYKDKNLDNEFIKKETFYKRIAFADNLKEEASIIYGIPHNIKDSQKDIKKYTHLKTQKLISARDIYIEWGTYRILDDPYYWCRSASTNIDPCKTITNIFTDWRYIDEFNYLNYNFNNISTWRLFRSDVPYPDISISSEHNLDNFKTDYLLVRKDLDYEFQKAILLFPQYKNYVHFLTI